MGTEQSRLNLLDTSMRFANTNLNFQVGISGLTGHIEFKEGKRSNFKLDLLKLKKEKLQKVGHWSSNTGINITDPTAFYETTVKNITLIVMTREVRIASSATFHQHFC